VPLPVPADLEHAPTVTGMHPRDVLAQAARDPDIVDRYAPGPDHVIDLYLPPGNEPAPVIVLAHGGYWQFDRRPCRLLAGALADDGFIVVLPEYRLTGGGGGWPQSYRDIRAAVNHLPELLAKLAQPSPVDIVLVGHSAGGHMVMWLTRRVGLPAEITRVVALAPAADLRSMYDRHLNDAAMIALMGGSPEQVPDRYAAADALTGNATEVPITVLHGADDEVIPVEMSRAVTGVEYRELSGIGHFDIIDPRTPAYPAVLAAVRGDSQGGMRTARPSLVESDHGMIWRSSNAFGKFV
jgi:acetyl esterase/lipase